MATEPMCGIAGYFAAGAGAPPPDRAELAAMGARMARRGPDGEGLWLDAEAGIGFVHRRLSIIDLSHAADQPMRDPGNGATIVFNGEIYNFESLRDELIAAGETFATHGDTEVLLALWRRRGPAMLGALRGMYALAIHDPAQDALFLARDPFGIKPLYIAQAPGKGLRFASQVKALLAGGGLATTPSPAGHAGFFVFGHIPEPFTLYREIRSLPPGTGLLVDRSGRAEAFDGGEIDALFRDTAPLRLPVDEAREAFADALRDSLRHHFVADVPVGLFLSAGLDSASLLALSADLDESRRAGPLQTVTLGFAEFAGTAHDEVPPAAAIAARYGAAHAVERIGREDFLASRAAILAAMDSPSIDGVNTWFVSRAAHNAGLKVALSGLGGDELLGGYSDFRTLPELRDWLSLPARLPLAAEAFAATVRALRLDRRRPKLPGLLRHGRGLAEVYLLSRSLALPMELDAFVDPALAREGLEELMLDRALPALIEGVEDDADAISLLLASLYMRNQLLRDSDWASMDHSLELRVPLVDVALWRTVIGLRRGGHRMTKADMARSMRDPLPAGFVARPKTGFAVPVPRWLAQAGAAGGGEPGLRGWAREVARELAA